MVNNDRIVPVQKIDLLSLYATILSIVIDQQIAILASKDVAGTFEADGDQNNLTLICNQPVKTLEVTSGLEDGKIYFVAAYDFESVKYGGNAVEPDDEIINDAATLYALTLDGAEPTLAAVAPYAE